jgi:hypothetical protein
MSEKITTLPVTVDKSHLITIGEQLYSESIELVRELVNNAYDADATRVQVLVEEGRLVVNDNGTGMDLEGLKQYFNIGSPLKRQQGKSEIFGRDLIGQFGIGKFATLSACERFEVSTRKGDSSAIVTFDKKDWWQRGEKWELPLEINPADGREQDGTTVILHELKKQFDPAEVKSRLGESVPINAPDFEVFVNRERVQPPRLSGHRIPFLEGTEFGVIHGEIVILPSSAASTSNLGIDCKVKQVTIKRELFGMEFWGKDVTRIRGEVYADFLPITSDRSGFIVDSAEYKAFLQAMSKVMREVKSVLGQLSNKRENRVASRAVREALERIQKSLLAHPELSPFGPIPLSDGKPAIGESGVVTPSKEEQPESIIGKEEAVIKPKKKKRKGTPKAGLLTPNAVVRKVKIGSTGVVCCLDHFGPEGPESFSEENIIYINRDYPLYKAESKKRDAHILNLARLISQEISLMRNLRNPRRAFEQQSILLRDAFKE